MQSWTPFSTWWSNPTALISNEVYEQFNRIDFRHLLKRLDIICPLLDRNKERQRLINGNTAFAGVDEQFREISSRRYVELVKYLSDNVPFQPENLMTNQALIVKPGIPGQVLFCNYSNSIQIREFAANPQGQSPFQYQLKSPQDVHEIVDYTQDLNSIVYGFDYIDTPRLYALRYQSSVSVLDSSSESLHRWNMDANIVDVRSMSQLDGFASLDESGSLQLFDLESGQTSMLWEKQFQKGFDKFLWGRLAQTTHPSLLNVMTRKAISTFDTRTRNDEIPWFQLEQNGGQNNEIILSTHTTLSNPNVVVVLTNYSVFLLDQRAPSEPIWELPHVYDYALPMGCDSVLVDQIEYLAIYYQDGEVALVPIDTKDSSQMAKEVFLHSNRFLLSDFLYESEYPRHRLRVPWSGMQIFSHEKDQISIMASNVVGDLFLCDLGHSESNLFKWDVILDKNWFTNRDWSESEETWIRSWSECCEHVAFKKLSRFHEVRMREGLPAPPPIVKPRKKRKGTSKAPESKTKKKKKQPAKKTKPNPEPFVAMCPLLEKLNQTRDDLDDQDFRVIDIFNERTIFPQLDDDENDVSTIPTTIVLKGGPRNPSASKDDVTVTKRKNGNQSTSMDNIPTDSNFVLDQFFTGLDTSILGGTQEIKEDFRHVPITSTQEMPESQPMNSEKDETRLDFGEFSDDMFGDEEDGGQVPESISQISTHLAPVGALSEEPILGRSSQKPMDQSESLSMSLLNLTGRSTKSKSKKRKTIGF